MAILVQRLDFDVYVREAEALMELMKGMSLDIALGSGVFVRDVKELQVLVGGMYETMRECTTRIVALRAFLGA